MIRRYGSHFHLLYSHNRYGFHCRPVSFQYYCLSYYYAYIECCCNLGCYERCFRHLPTNLREDDSIPNRVGSNPSPSRDPKNSSPSPNQDPTSSNPSPSRDPKNSNPNQDTRSSNPSRDTRSSIPSPSPNGKPKANSNRCSTYLY